MPGRSRHRNRCRHCGRPLQRFNRCRRRTCPGYRNLWAGDWKVVLAANVAPLPGVALITITAPGQDVGLVWDRSKCSHPEGERCSGMKGCQVLKAAADRWHQDHQRRLAQLHRAAAGRVRRRYGSGPLIAAKAWERQRRGVDHVHLIVPYDTPRERARAKAYIAAVKQLGPRYLWGYADLRETWGGPTGGARAAGYCAKYIGKATAEAIAPRVRRPVFVGAFLTTRSGITMRALRWRRYLYVLAKEAASSARSKLPSLDQLPPSLPFTVPKLAQAP